LYAALLQHTKLNELLAVYLILYFVVRSFKKRVLCCSRGLFIARRLWCRRAHVAGFCIWTFLSGCL